MTYGSNITKLLVLFASTRHSHEENNDPRNPDFQPHLQVDRPETRVEACTHKDIINEVTRHANLVAGSDSEEVHPEGNTETDNHRHGHKMPEVVDDSSQAEDASVVKNGRRNPSDVDATKSIALVH